MKFSALLVGASLVVTSFSAHAFDFGTVFGSSKKKPATTMRAYDTNMDDSAMPHDMEYDSTAGMNRYSTATTSDEITLSLAAERLGVPNEYMPQLQALYEKYKSSGSLMKEDIRQYDGLDNWVEQKPGLNNEIFASALTGFFAAHN